MLVVRENRSFDGADARLFPFGGLARHYAVPTDQKPVVDDIVDIVFLRHPKRSVAFARPARADQRADIQAA